MVVVKRIQQLPVYLANQIAAGEVIERPASVLKELLENSLDAKSTQIDINVERGGIGSIRVQDNGVGICKEDLKLAVAAHATSKIETSSDLEGIVSYGFRGEALASISAVSRLRLNSATDEQDMGWGIQIEGRDATPLLTPVPKCNGTLVEVCDLFYNTPARRKFLRAEKTEMAYLEEVFKRIALSQPQVAFKFAREGRLQKRLPVCRHLEAHTKRVALLCGQSFINEAYYIDAENNGLKLTGWLGSAKAMRSQADLQYFYVNGRIVRDKVVMHALRQAYQEVAKVAIEGRHPAYILYFELDPAAVDVNVHPTKHEVRFREARTVHAFLSYTLKEGLIKGNNARPSQSELHQNFQPAFERQDPKQRFSFLYQTEGPYVKADVVLPKEVDAQKNLYSPCASSDKWGGVLAESLLFVENENEVIIVDIKVARQVLMNRMLVDAYEQDSIKKRLLIMPKMVMILKNNKKTLFNLDWDRLGFEITEAGENAVLVRSVPEVFGIKIDALDNLLPKLLILSDVYTIFRLIVDFIVENSRLEEEQQKQLFVDILALPDLKGNNEYAKFYKKITIDQLRSLLFQRGVSRHVP